MAQKEKSSKTGIEEIVDNNEYLAENSNAIGLKYKGYTVMCTPKTGKIIDDKARLFTNCLVKGYVERINDETHEVEKRPRVIYLEIVELPNGFTPSLFG